LRLIGIAALAGMLFQGTSWAQGGGAACPIASMTPKIITAATLQLTSQNGCNVFVFVNLTGTIVSAPAAINTPQGYFVTLIPGGPGGVTITTAAGLVNGRATAALVQGETVNLVSDGNNYWTVGSPTQAPASNPNLGVVPGTFASNSATFFLPPGILQFTAPASVISGAYPFAACVGAPTIPVNVTKAPTVGGRWLLIKDYYGQPGLIPIC
jgi:hypothetical protein